MIDFQLAITRLGDLESFAKAGRIVTRAGEAAYTLGEIQEITGYVKALHWASPHKERRTATKQRRARGMGIGNNGVWARRGIKNSKTENGRRVNDVAEHKERRVEAFSHPKRYSTSADPRIRALERRCAPLKVKGGQFFVDGRPV